MDYEPALKELRSSFSAGKTRNVEWRVKQLEALLRMYEENEALLCDALYRDLRKSKLESLGTEIDFLKNDIVGILRDVRTWTKSRPAAKTIPTMLDRAFVKPEPFGVVLIIGAWNYPLHLTLLPLAGAIAAGNCAVVKPSEISAHTAKCIEELFPKYVDKTCFKVINGGVAETTVLLKHKFDYIFYTGSTAVGKIVGAAANAHLTPCTLELGGKSPVYVDDAVNMEVTAKRLLWGKAINAGQTCIAPDYVLCSKATEKRLIKEMSRLIKVWFGERPQESKDFCRIVSERHFDRLLKMLNATKGQVGLGGSYDRSDLYFGLTVLTDVSPSDPVMQEEIFGPLLPFVTVTSPREAVDFINAGEKPLVLYLFSEDKKVKKLFLEETSSGGLAVNECLLQMSVDDLPFGGVGASGMGAYHGKTGFDTFTHHKGVLIRDCGWLGETVGSIRYPPYTEAQIPWMRMLMKNRWLPSMGFVGYFGSFLLGALAGAVGIVAGMANPKRYDS